MKRGVTYLQAMGNNNTLLKADANFAIAGLEDRNAQKKAAVVEKRKKAADAGKKSLANKEADGNLTHEDVKPFEKVFNASEYEHWMDTATAIRKYNESKVKEAETDKKASDKAVAAEQREKQTDEQKVKQREFNNKVARMRSRVTTPEDKEKLLDFIEGANDSLDKKAAYNSVTTKAIIDPFEVTDNKHYTKLLDDAANGLIEPGDVRPEMYRLSRQDHKIVKTLAEYSIKPDKKHISSGLTTVLRQAKERIYGVGFEHFTSESAEIKFSHEIENFIIDEFNRADTDDAKLDMLDYRSKNYILDRAFAGKLGDVGEAKHAGMFTRKKPGASTGTAPGETRLW